MSTEDKLIEAFFREPPEVSFSDVERILVSVPVYTLKRTSGSHHVFTEPGRYPFTVPVVKGRRVKRTYVKKINELLREAGYGNKGDDE